MPGRKVDAARAGDGFVATGSAAVRDGPSEAEAWALLLAVHGLGPAGFAALLVAHGSALGILEAAGRQGAAGRFTRIAAEADGRPIFGPRVGEDIVAIAAGVPERLALLRSSGLVVLTLDDPRYPPRLRAIDLPPPVLLVRGDVAAFSAERAVAIVGTRRPTERGRLIAARIGAAIARAGAVVVSGLAVGIDGAAHAAVEAEGRPTVAVLGSGHRQLFPRAHERLAEGIVRSGGAVVSELWPDQPASKNTFPQRNRLISGLADTTVVVEAGERSGALITADRALRQGRGLFVVPGPIDEPRSAGCLEWLRSYPGEARVVAGIPQLIEDLGLCDADGDEAGTRAGRRATGTGGRGAVRRPSLDAELIELGPTARAVAMALVAGHGTLDELVAETAHEPATLLGAITLLEVRGLVTTTFGRYRAAGRLAAATPDPPLTAPRSAP